MNKKKCKRKTKKLTDEHDTDSSNAGNLWGDVLC